MNIDVRNVIKRPIVTERASLMKENHNQVVFEVDLKATKPVIRAAIEKAFKVKVTSINTMVMPGKYKRVGQHAGRTSKWKKAVATLKEGDSIEVVEGV